MKNLGSGERGIEQTTQLDTRNCYKIGGRHTERFDITTRDRAI